MQTSVVYLYLLKMGFGLQVLMALWRIGNIPRWRKGWKHLQVSLLMHIRIANTLLNSVLKPLMELSNNYLNWKRIPRIRFIRFNYCTLCIFCRVFYSTVKKSQYERIFPEWPRLERKGLMSCLSELTVSKRIILHKS